MSFPEKDCSVGVLVEVEDNSIGNQMHYSIINKKESDVSTKSSKTSYACNQGSRSKKLHVTPHRKDYLLPSYCGWKTPSPKSMKKIKTEASNIVNSLNFLENSFDDLMANENFSVPDPLADDEFQSPKKPEENLVSDMQFLFEQHMVSLNTSLRETHIVKTIESNVNEVDKNTVNDCVNISNNCIVPDIIPNQDQICKQNLAEEDNLRKEITEKTSSYENGKVEEFKSIVQEDENKNLNTNPPQNKNCETEINNGLGKNQSQTAHISNQNNDHVKLEEKEDTVLKSGKQQVQNIVPNYQKSEKTPLKTCILRQTKLKSEGRLFQNQNFTKQSILNNNFNKNNCQSSTPKPKFPCLRKPINENSSPNKTLIGNLKNPSGAQQARSIQPRTSIHKVSNHITTTFSHSSPYKSTTKNSLNISDNKYLKPTSNQNCTRGGLQYYTPLKHFAGSNSNVSGLPLSCSKTSRLDTFATAVNPSLTGIPKHRQSLYVHRSNAVPLSAPRLSIYSAKSSKSSIPQNTPKSKSQFALSSMKRNGNVSYLKSPSTRKLQEPLARELFPIHK